ncbi:MAG: PspA/IM30 family protein [Chloroflexi bacterium]|nr:PspA/IM30 family protein [Chloroflexota bacterium]
MGILDRISTILRANINDMLDKAEDPEKMLEQILRDMETQIGEARNAVATMIAQEKELKADMEENDRLAGEWQRKAELALTRDQDDLAREALKRKNTYASNADTYRTQWAAQKEMVVKLKDQLRMLESKYQQALSQKDVLIARRRRAQAQQQVSKTISGLPKMDATSELDRMERKIRGEEAKAEALAELGTDSLDAQFAELERDAGVDDELAALKARVKGTPASTATVPPAQ